MELKSHTNGIGIDDSCMPFKTFNTKCHAIVHFKIEIRKKKRKKNEDENKRRNKSGRQRPSSIAMIIIVTPLLASHWP